eukprot:m.175986 g.175986  ORF g.175986 m.175986 type:complete len:306 (+) comp31837_c0_seq1:41-958(+)
MVMDLPQNVISNDWGDIHVTETVTGVVYSGTTDTPMQLTTTPAASDIGSITTGPLPIYATTVPSDLNTTVAATQTNLKPTNSAIIWTVSREPNAKVQSSQERTAVLLKRMMWTVHTMSPTEFANRFPGITLDQQRTMGDVVTITDPNTGKKDFVHQISFRVTHIGGEPANRDNSKHCERLSEYPIEGIVQSLYLKTAEILFGHLTTVQQMKIQYQGPNNEVVEVATPEAFVSAMDEMKANNLPINFVRKPTALDDPTMLPVFLDHLRKTIRGALNHTPTSDISYWEQEANAIVAGVEALEQQAYN